MNSRPDSSQAPYLHARISKMWGHKTAWTRLPTALLLISTKYLRANWSNYNKRHKLPATVHRNWGSELSNRRFKKINFLYFKKQKNIYFNIFSNKKTIINIFLKSKNPP